MKTHLKELAEGTYLPNLAKLVFSKRSFHAIMLSLAIVVGSFTFASCTDDTNKPEEPKVPEVPQKPEIPEVVTYKLKLKSTGIVEFKQMLSKQNAQDLAVTESSKYFGKRIELNCPTELLFKGDSLFISKVTNLTESYKTKWQDKELYLYDDASKTWKYCGKKGDKSGFTLNTGFYVKKCKDKMHTLAVIGQEYSLRTYADLTNYLGETTNTTSSITWLRTEYIFE